MHWLDFSLRPGVFNVIGEMKSSLLTTLLPLSCPIADYSCQASYMIVFVLWLEKWKSLIIFKQGQGIYWCYKWAEKSLLLARCLGVPRLLVTDICHQFLQLCLWRTNLSCGEICFVMCCQTAVSTNFKGAHLAFEWLQFHMNSLDMFW